jgi:hypothetical protein
MVLPRVQNKKHIKPYWNNCLKVTLYDENTDFITFYIFIDLYSGAGDLSIAASFFQKY